MSPFHRATVLRSFGLLQFVIGVQRGDSARLRQAVAVYRAALDEQARERVPLDWARTQNNLGNALSRLGERESGTERLEEAVAAYRAALEELTLERSSHYRRIALANFVRTDGLLGARIAKENNKHPAR
jgi:tetratricopeptide (TPR) repeat protein